MSTPQRILIVEDEERLAALVADYLRAAGFVVDLCFDGLAVMDQVRAQRPDLILLDLMLPGKDGLTLCREVRATGAIPIIMTTARVEELDRLLGLELGADDYVCKPYSPRELVARVRAVLRRSTGTTGAGGSAGGTGPDPANQDPLSLDPDRLRVQGRGAGNRTHRSGVCAARDPAPGPGPHLLAGAADGAHLSGPPGGLGPYHRQPREEAAPPLKRTAPGAGVDSLGLWGGIPV